jgi:outer membrane protein
MFNHNLYKMRLSLKYIVLFLALPALGAHGQNIEKSYPDSLSLSSVINEVIHNYPSIKKIESDIESANAKIGMAKSAYFPDVNLSSSYTRIGPTSSISFPGFGTFDLYPANNYSATLNYNQTLYDFGKTAKNISFEQQNKELAVQTEELVKQRLSLTLVGTYYSIVFLQEAINIKDQELATLTEHLHFVEKKNATGSATEYEILTTKVRISTIENQKTDLLTSLQVQSCQLNLFLGQSEKTKLKVKKELQTPQAVVPSDSLIAYAIANREEMKIARQKIKMNEIRYKMVGAQNNPVFNVMASGGFKNGYVPDLDVAKANYAVGVGFRVPIFDATRTKNSRLQVKADLQGNSQDVELARRNIINEIVESQANVDAALRKITQSELQLKQAMKAYSMAEASFQAGAITNVELLDNSTTVAESRLSLLKTQIDYTVSLLKLKIVTGERIYQ